MYKTFISLILWPIWFLFFSFSMMLLLILILTIPRKYLYIYVSPLCWFYCFLGGQWLRKENNPPDPEGQPYLYMFNHVSMFDQFMIGAFVRHYITAVGAIEQFHYPIWGQIIKQYGVIPIVRKEIRKAIKSLSAAEDALNNGVSFIISPEGTRTLTGELSPFKKGPFHLAKNTGATIVPIGLHGGLKAKKKDDWRLRPGILTTRFGTPITNREYGDLTVDEIKDLVRERIQQLIAT